MAVCDVCRCPADETAFSHAAGGLTVCEQCHVRAPAVDDPGVIGRQLGIRPCDECREPLGGRYDGLCWPCFDRKHPEPVRRRKPSPAKDYATWVRRVWGLLEQHTGRTVFYLDATSIVGYCPACWDGTLRIRFLDRPEPSIAVSSRDGGPGCCSHGCPEGLIARVLFG